MQALRREIAEMQQKREAAQSALNTMVENLQMEATLQRYGFDTADALSYPPSHAFA